MTLLDAALFDECALGVALCHKEHGKCTNIAGGTYMCSCNDGYEGNGIDCRPCQGACVAKSVTVPPSVQRQQPAFSKPPGGWPGCPQKDMHQCLSTGECVKRSYILDGIPDCQDESDEGEN